MKNKIKIISLLVAFVMTMTVFVGCSDKLVILDKPVYDSIADEILAEKQDEVITDGNDANGKVASVSLASEKSITNTKTDFRVDVSGVTGNVYDPSEVDVYGEFIDPNGEVKEVPAFYTQDYDISLNEQDRDVEYAYPTTDGFTQTGTSDIKGVIDNGDTNKSVGKLYLTSGGTVSKSLYLDKVGSNTNTFYFYVKALDGATDLKVNFSGKTTIAETDLSSEVSDEWQRLTINLSEYISDELTGGEMLAGTDSIIFSGEGEFLIREMGTQRTTNNGYSGAATFAELTVVEYQFFNERDTFYGEEKVTVANTAPYFCVRYNAQTAGDYTYRIIFKTNGKLVSKFTSTFTAEAPEVEKSQTGVIKVEEEYNRNFVFEDSEETYLPVGMNVGWYEESLGDKNSYEIENYFIAMGESDLNWARMWLAQWQFSMHNPTDGILNFDSRLIEAARFDKVMEDAEANEIYITLCLLIHGAFRDGDEGRATMWSSNPFNEALGGYIDSDNPIEILESERFMEDFKKITRYTLARWGYSENIMAWEVFNEVGHMSGYADYQQASCDFHVDIANYIRTVDQLDHMVTSSSASTEDIIYGVDELDYINPHWYGATYGVALSELQQKLYDQYGKPILVSELGPSGNNNSENFASDTVGDYLNQAAWAGNFGNGAGGGMSWWWEAIHGYDLYYQYEPVLKYFELTDKDHAYMPLLSADNYTVSNDTIMKAMGYLSNNKAYVYISHSNFTRPPVSLAAVNGSSITMDLDDGTYDVIIFDCNNGEILSEVTGTATSGKITVSLPAWTNQVAIIVK